MTSIRTKQKIVAQEVLYEFPLPKPGQKIVKITDQGANNLHHIQTEEGDRFLVSMPTKFRNWIYIKRNFYVIIDPIAEGKKVKGEITSILYPEQITYIADNGLWPEAFSDAVKRRASYKEKKYLDDDLLPPSSDELESETDTDLEDDEDSENDDEEEAAEDENVEESEDVQRTEKEIAEPLV